MHIPGLLALTRFWVSTMSLVREAPGWLVTVLQRYYLCTMDPFHMLLFFILLTAVLQKCTFIIFNIYSLMTFFWIWMEY